MATLASVQRSRIEAYLTHYPGWQSLKAQKARFFPDSHWIKSVVGQYSIWGGYFVAQATPFMPMRTSLLTYLLVANPPHRLVFLGAFLGGTVRMVLMYLMVYYGLRSVQELLYQ